MKFIPLSNGMITVVDDEDFENLSVHSWNAIICERWIAATRTSYESGSKQTVYMHREILSAPEGILVDHRDGIGLNNCRSNLRLCSVAQNQANRRVATNASGLKGVRFEKRQTRHPWVAQIKINKQTKYLGGFATSEEAADAYDRAAIELFGEFAATNIALSKSRARFIEQQLGAT